MRKILVLNGPNINLLGIREPDVYGNKTYRDLVFLLKEKGKKVGVKIKICQSNHEGKLIDWIQRASGRFDGIVINAGGYTHTSIAIADALRAVSLPAVEVHVSDIESREEYRRVSMIRPCCIGFIAGKGIDGYADAVDMLLSHSRFAR